MVGGRSTFLRSTTIQTSSVLSIVTSVLVSELNWIVTNDIGLVEHVTYKYIIYIYTYWGVSFVVHIRIIRLGKLWTTWWSTSRRSSIMRWTLSCWMGRRRQRRISSSSCSRCLEQLFHGSVRNLWLSVLRTCHFDHYVIQSCGTSWIDQILY